MPILSTLFSFRGRINRKTFWLGGILPVYVIGIALGSLLPYVPSKANDVASGMMLRVLILTVLALLVYMWFLYVVCGNRQTVPRSRKVGLAIPACTDTDSRFRVPALGGVVQSRAGRQSARHLTELTRLPESADVTE